MLHCVFGERGQQQVPPFFMYAAVAAAAAFPCRLFFFFGFAHFARRIFDGLLSDRPSVHNEMISSANFIHVAKTQQAQQAT